MPKPLVSLEQAKDHLRVVSSLEDADIQLKLSAATGMAVSYLDRGFSQTRRISMRPWPPTQPARCQWCARTWSARAFC